MSPRLVAVYARKYEPDHLVDDLLANIGWVDGIVCLDQRDRTGELWSRRDERVRELQRLAHRAGADWVLHMDPDERLEDGAEEVIRQVIARRGGPIAYKLHLKELYTPTAYRTDGIWGRKTRRRLYHLTSRLKDPHVPPVLLNLNMYHLKHIEPANRKLRARVHNAANTWDRGGRPGGGGFDYIADERGLVLEEIPAGRGYTPAYTRPYEFRVPEELL